MLSKIVVVVAMTLVIFVEYSEAHARLTDPPSRASMWRQGYSNPHDYNDHQGFCGGFSHQEDLGGQCGICGDPYDMAHPRDHEAGGVYGNGIIVRNYIKGQVMFIQVEITANHYGYFEFRICANNNTSVEATQECLDEHLLTIHTSDGDTDYTRYHVVHGYVGLVDLDVQLPGDMLCTQCVIQWKYNAGNSWGTHPNGTGCIGCGVQEQFYACADVAIHPEGYIIPPQSQESQELQESQEVEVAMAAQPDSEVAMSTTPINTALLTSCIAIGDWAGYDMFDDWCEVNCNFATPYCPDHFCVCPDSSDKRNKLHSKLHERHLTLDELLDKLYELHTKRDEVLDKRDEVHSERDEARSELDEVQHKRDESLNKLRSLLSKLVAQEKINAEE